MLWQRPLHWQETKDRGIGVFAVDLIKAGELIYSGDGELAPGERLLTTAEIEELAPEAKKLFHIHADQVGEDLFIGPVEPKLLHTETHLIPYLINHSCDPNIWFENDYTMSARRDIQPGEEITFDYCTTDLSSHSFKCYCGSPLCRHVITGDDWQKMKPIYGRHFRDYINKLV